MKSCFFIGHREASEEIFPELTETVEHHIVDYGVTEFIVGNYGGFGRMAVSIIISLMTSDRQATGTLPSESALSLRRPPIEDPVLYAFYR